MDQSKELLVGVCFYRVAADEEARADQWLAKNPHDVSAFVAEFPSAKAVNNMPLGCTTTDMR